VICTVGDKPHSGRYVRLPADVDARAVARAVREGETSDGERSIKVRARRPHPVHERVGYVHPAMGLRPRTALAAAARARGCSTPVNREIRDCWDRLQSFSVADVPTTEQRERLADASGETARLRERTAELRGELAARREDEAATDGVAAQFRDTARELSEAETSVTAARQTLDRRRREAREARDRLERRLALEDDLANLRRRARSHLVDRLRDAYESALGTVPGSPGASDPFDADPVTTALAVARVADFDAPVVLACDRFDSPRAASAWLNAPVISLPEP
jgi:hypothetical protein